MGFYSKRGQSEIVASILILILVVSIVAMIGATLFSFAKRSNQGVASNIRSQNLDFEFDPTYVYQTCTTGSCVPPAAGGGAPPGGSFDPGVGAPAPRTPEQDNLFFKISRSKDKENITKLIFSFYDSNGNKIEDYEREAAKPNSFAVYTFTNLSAKTYNHVPPVYINRLTIAPVTNKGEILAIEDTYTFSKDVWCSTHCDVWNLFYFDCGTCSAGKLSSEGCTNADTDCPNTISPDATHWKCVNNKCMPKL